MTESYRRSGDELPQDRPYADGDDYGHPSGHEAGGAAQGAPGAGERAFPPPRLRTPPSRRRPRRGAGSAGRSR